MVSLQALHKNTPEDVVAHLVDEIKQVPSRRKELVALLPERLNLYAGRSTNEVIRMRGYIMAAFEDTGLPETALPYVLEELESGRDAYMVAAAAKALRGLNAPDSRFTSFLFTAAVNIKFLDDSVTFKCFKPRWPLSNHTSALKEIFKTFSWLGIYAQSSLPDLENFYEESDYSKATKAEIKKAIEHIRSITHHDKVDCCTNTIKIDALDRPAQSESKDCCSSSLSLDLLSEQLEVNQPAISSVVNITLEDQSGIQLKFEDYFCQIPTILTFFYSRCDNPDKCSLSISKLAELQKDVEEEGLAGKLKIAAITYDPEYDRPLELTRYGEDRGFKFNKNNRFFRSTNGFGALQAYFNLGVNFNRSIVNRHRIELFVLDGQGNIVSAFTRLQWDIRKVLQRAKSLI